MAAVLVVGAALAPRAVADDSETIDPLPAIGDADAAPAADAAPVPAPDAAPAPALPRLGGVDVVAPRVFGGTGSSNESAVTPLRRELPAFDQPAAVTVLDQGDVRLRRASRSLANVLDGVPSVLVQKTAPLQASPFIRGLTGYYNVLLIDGVRLNHSAMRSGPNQYWSTVDPYTIGSLEVVRGPHSVLYGSDAIGGTVNVRTPSRDCWGCGWGLNGRLLTRYATAEDAWAQRVEFEGHSGRLGYWGGVTHRTYGTIESGAGALPDTGGIEEFDADLRMDWHLSRQWTATLAFQHVAQRDAPRTEQTVNAVPFQGTAVGSELRRDFDQDRDLAYARLAYEGGACAPIRRGQVTVSWHRHQENRDRLRTGDRRDFTGFDLGQLGVQVQLESPLRWGSLVYGADWYHDEVDSWKHNFVAGVPTGSEVQGPLGDDASYDLASVFAEHHLPLGCWDVYTGVRFTYAAARADRVDNQAVAGTDPATPGNIIAIENDWTNLVGSVRVVRHLDAQWNAYGAVSQGFRAPSLSDLTSLDSTSVVESPAPDLEPEDFLSFELGLKTQQKRLRGSVAAWYTQLENSIVRSPTGVLIDGTPEVRKDNVGDGYAWGLELEAAWEVAPCWTLLATASWMDGEVDQLDTSDNLVRTPIDRLKPLSWLLGMRYQPCNGRWWAQAEWLHSEKADKLSLRDETDTRRIPPGGTPGWDVLNLRMGYQLNRKASVSLGLENLLDENYRVHGSGVNEPGFNVVLAAEVGF
jgi:hemoglobin/transferrin/lactoferrin receptor protein